MEPRLEAATHDPRQDAFVRGDAENGMAVTIEDDLLSVTAFGDPPDGALIECFRDALACGAMKQALPALIDLTAFRGHVDWRSIREVKNLLPWSGAASTKIAYVTESPWFGAVLKVAHELYPGSHHRQFADLESALHWLRA